MATGLATLNCSIVDSFALSPCSKSVSSIASDDITVKSYSYCFSYYQLLADLMMMWIKTTTIDYEYY